ncbi:MAG TPA: sigma-70 family RNA polymerase sigma factor [Polyangiales bacterium]|nr:sigma-70 family RNA polymerase sigma factor [Polyangiales bacterium]
MHIPAPQSDAALTDYIRRVRAIPRLSREDEHALALLAVAGNIQAAHRLVEANLRFVVAVALQYRRYGIPISELIAEGSLGLMLAVRKFDPDRGTRFVTYAGYWIRAYVLNLVVKSASMVGGGSGVLRSKLYFRLRRERAKLATLEQDSGRVVEELAERFHVDAERMSRMLRQLDAKDVSLDVAAHPDSAHTMLDTLRDDSQNQEDELAASEQQDGLTGRLDVALDSLDRRERYIVEQRIMGEDDVSLAELGRRLGVSRERARQIEARAKRKLRKQLQSLQSDAA